MESNLFLDNYNNNIQYTMMYHSFCMYMNISEMFKKPVSNETFYNRLHNPAPFFSRNTLISRVQNLSSFFNKIIFNFFLQTSSKAVFT